MQQRATKPAHRQTGALLQAILRKVWSLKLRRSGFHDIERPNDDRLSSWRYPTHVSPGSEVAEVAAHYRRMEHLSARFENEMDRNIGVALSDGWPVRHLKDKLGVGQDRIERVAKQLRIWMKEKENDEDG